jgi:hypothetical protein
MSNLAWKRTGKITLRAEPYLIMRLISDPKYLALYGPQTARSTIGRYDTAPEAQKACQGHADAIAAADAADATGAEGEKNPEAP